MPHPLGRLVAPVIVGVAAGIGAVVAQSMLTRRGPAQPSLGAPERPLPFEGWWSSDASSPMAYAHPAVLFVDGGSRTVVDSWDRRTRSRVPNPRIVGSEPLPTDAIAVLDASTGDVLQTLHTPGMARG
ncbi:hypothetical protein [Agrococcus sp. SGAir0287]|uniref:hypothetical protein n=1 Tax=Agrococcus sp. SGAir0287 TaxID=2070347 RepID=UPI0010CCE2E4|nr:hypothetical protein [Agrococcus sp. SGAir0287]QCR20545.1 hypothetical protein C1N71_14760 [Agrococcus sp. SGAir0287]